MTRKIALPLLAASLLCACSLAPTYQRPDAPVAAAFPAQDQAAGDVSSIGWRNFFPDARLQALIAAALENNRDLRTAAFRIEEARALYNIQSADLLPTINATANGSRGKTSSDFNPLSQSALRNNYQVGLGLAAFELDFFGRVRSLSHAALSQYLATEEAFRSSRISIVAEVAKAYLAERAFDEQVELARKSLVSREKSYELAKQRYDVGASSALDLKLTETLVLSARVSLATLARQRAQARNALTLLVGKPLTDLPDLVVAQPLSAQNIVTDIPAGLPSDLLNRRPDILAAERRLQAANASIGAARAAFFPRISLTAGVGTASIALSGLFDSGSSNWNFAPQLVLPLFDSGRHRANLNLTEARKNLAVADYERAIQVAFKEVSDALAARATLEEQIAAQRGVQQAQTERLALSELRLQNGVASSLDVLDAQRELFTAEQSLVQARLLRLANAIDLYRALGGGVLETTVDAQGDVAPETP